MRIGFLASLAFVLCLGVAQGQTVYTVSLDGTQAGTPSAFTGSGTVTLNQAQNQITVALTHNIPNVNVTMGHIHQGAIGISGPIIFPFNSASSPISETFSVSPSELATLQAGNYYVNIHTAAFSNGEIRGQVEPPVTPMDTDQDLLDDSVETNTGTFVSASDTGTDPNNPDSDGDGVMDGIEVQLGNDPNDNLDFPTGLPVHTQWLLIGVAGAIVLTVSVVFVRRASRKA